MWSCSCSKRARRGRDGSDDGLEHSSGGRERSRSRSSAQPSTHTGERAALTAELDDSAEALAGMIQCYTDASDWEVVRVPDAFKCITTDDVPDVSGVDLRRLLFR